mgnify:CR=1 FL=1
MEKKEKMPFTYVDVKTIKSHNSNPWGLVYNGAITENKEGAVSIHSITYELNGLKIAANVYTPAGYDRAKSLLSAGWSPLHEEHIRQRAGRGIIQSAYGRGRLYLSCV